MNFTPQNIAAWAKDHQWLVALILVIGCGYVFGKDMALRDNLAERQALGETE